MSLVHPSPFTLHPSPFTLQSWRNEHSVERLVFDGHDLQRLVAGGRAKGDRVALARFQQRPRQRGNPRDAGSGNIGFVDADEDEFTETLVVSGKDGAELQRLTFVPGRGFVASDR